MFWSKRLAIAEWLIEVVRKWIVPAGSNLKYRLKPDILNQHHSILCRPYPNENLRVNYMCIESYENSAKHGFWDKERNIGEMAMLMVTELAEMFEEYRKGNGLTEIYYLEGKPEGIPIEMADLAIRLGDFCGGWNIDLEKAIKIKQAYNATRPRMHGKKC